MTPTNLPPLVLRPSDRASQSTVRLPLPMVAGNRDYQERQRLLQRMNEILVLSGIEQRFVDRALSEEITAMAAIHKPLTDRRRSSVQQYARRTLRCTVARILSNESHRQFSCHLAESPLLQWFCGCDSLGLIRVPTKSTLQRNAPTIFPC
jgi:hypothetical protein